MTFLKPFYLLLALIALQLFPLTGVFLMIVAGALITGLVVHVVLVLMAFDALTRRGPAWLLLFPALFYGGYYLRYAQQEREIARVSNDLSATNPKRILDFDPDAHSLVMKDAGGFVSAHDVPVAYTVNKNFQPEGHLSYRLIPRAQCDAVKKDTQARIQTWGVHADGVFQKGVCQLQFPQAPPHPVVSVVVTPDLNDYRLKPGVNIRTTEIVVDGRILGVYRTGMISRLPNFPWLYAGCALNSGRPAWECDWGVMRSRFTIEGRPAGVDPSLYDTPVALMLGIRKYPLGALKDFRGFPQNADVLDALERDRLNVEDQAFDALERVLAGGQTEGFLNLGYAVTQNPARLEPYAERMAQRLMELEAADAPTPGKPERWRNSRRDEPRALATAISSLSPQAFALLAARMFALAQRDHFWEEYEALYLRAADVGPPALDFYKAAFLERQPGRSYDSLPVLALCRIGIADPALVAEMKARYLLPDKSRPEGQQAALFLALMNFGETDFLRANEALAPSRDRTWREALYAGKGRTPVGPNNCMTEQWGSIAYRSAILQPALVRARNGWEDRPK
ncbi:MAG: hypothetical protein CTY15_03895 [Methylocystis sp.]|nr:MAG: hypothetical protein CTY15_03895 [Methylocystis sp.]